MEGSWIFPDGDQYDSGLMITGPVPVAATGRGWNCTKAIRSMRERFLLRAMTSEARGSNS